ncbi:uncharacterized protein LOC123675186 [Harmonia axyridis]|uniref:uncharacterized protein LOC123675186 n=1 Tax=Harmonia axyridis TaxID=115357 RepID=UPI001E275B5A|nr:uncharacterized protein LOC123675186 [Harmonia axyridis]
MLFPSLWPFIILIVPSLNYSPRKQMCKPKHHYWKPYVATGVDPVDAFPIGMPKNYTRTYIARVTVPYRQWSRVVPAQLMYDHVESPSIYGVNGSIERYADGLEVLHVTDKSEYHWMPVHSDKCYPNVNTIACYEHTHLICHQIMSCCCLVEGGIVWENEDDFQMYYIGRVIEDGKVKIGRALMRKNKKFGDDVGIFYLSGWNTKNRKSNFDVLAYDCNTKIPNCTAMVRSMYSSPNIERRWRTLDD